MSFPLRDAFSRDGFIVLRGGIPMPLVDRLRLGLDPIIGQRGQGRLGTGRHQAILDPACYHPSFKDFLNLPQLNLAAEEVIGTSELAFAGLAVLIGSVDHRVCNWHRDFKDGYHELPALLDRPNTCIQFNCALYDDRSLWIVPGSHRRASTAGESAFARRFEDLGFTSPYGLAAAIDPMPMASMPGAINVHLEPGDCALYNPLMWHAAEYRPEWKRATLHGGWRQASSMYEFEAMRWGIEHNPWLLEPAYLGNPGEFLGPQMERYNQAALRFHPDLKASAAAAG
ncbi:MAG: phytanoyl-CoA dioxygenase family protein [Planctomycetes bacterium]|nr:phytanoyl-CoA dioxygenase family protein [Planctomycetota bacterium]